jgi:hypothetical protein
MDAQEALAESWASIDGHLDTFQKCKADDKLEMSGGYFQEYMEDARQMIENLQVRGFTVSRN